MVALLILAGAVAVTGVIEWPTAKLVESYRLGAFRIPLGFLLTYFFVLWALSGPKLRQVAAVGLVGAALAWAFEGLFPFPGPKQFYFAYAVTLSSGGAGLVSLFLLGRGVFREDAVTRTRCREQLGAGSLVVLMSLYADSYLGLTAALHPATLDALAFHIDQTLGFQPSVAIAVLAQTFKPFDSLLVAAYSALPLGFAAMYAIQLSSGTPRRINLLMFWIGSAAAAWFAYHLVPISGPRYLFGNAFPLAVPHADQVPLAKVILNPAARNGFPSMHLGWAIGLWLIADIQQWKRARTAAALGVGATILATLGTGEHYLVDLVAGLPFVLMLFSIFLTGIPWSNPERQRMILAGGALTLVWTLVLYYGVPLFQRAPWLNALGIAVTVAVCAVCYRALRRAVHALDPPAEVPHPVARLPEHAAVRSGLRVAVAMFFLSGFAGLMYEVLFSKALALTFGSTSTATYTVLATYMAGMALGAFLGGRLAVGDRPPLLLYAACEVGIGIYCAATPAIFHLLQSGYVAVATGQAPDAPFVLASRFAFGTVGLLAPTILMGMTLPILARYFTDRSAHFGASVAVLYGANTLGAAFGALLAGYAIIPALGVTRTTLAAAAMDLLVGLIAMELHKKSALQPLAALYEPAAVCADSGRRLSVDYRLLARVAIGILIVGGVLTLAVEINYIHLLAVVAGNSTYAFSLMLFTFLLGLGLGAEAARRLLAGRCSLPRTLVGLETCMALVILGGVFLWSELPGYFSDFAAYPITRGFGAREFVRAMVCWIAMFPPAFFIGALYPVAMECVGRANPDRKVQALGWSAALNTVGNIGGVAVGGFVLLPMLGALRTIQLLALVCFALGVVVLFMFRKHMRRADLVAPAGAAALLVLQPGAFDYTALASGANVYFAAQAHGEVIDHAESIDGGLTAVAKVVPKGSGAPLLTLLTNGKFQGNNAMQGEMRAQVGFALTPLLHTAKRTNALVIGYGSGVTARAMHDAGFDRLDVVDLSKDVITLANRHFGDVNGRVTERGNVATHVTDGRNFLLLQPRVYDVIGIEVSSIWFAGAASLYNREFYALVKRRLAQDGVLQQWMQIHHITPMDALYILGSVRSEFRYVWFYLVGGQGMIIASNDRASAEPTFAKARRIDSTPALSPLLKIFEGSAASLSKSLVLTPEGVDAYLSGQGVAKEYWVSTDDNLYLEYSTPRGNAFDFQRSVEAVVATLEKYSSLGRSLAMH
ncbi:MAG: hypothetical protein Fur0039_18590 [Rhodocyclaceae bacterium]